MKEAEGWYSYAFDGSKLVQGTILFGAGIKTLSPKFYVVLNPECDLANGKSQYVNLVAQGDLIGSLQDILSGLAIEDDHWRGLKALSPKLFKNVVSKLKAQINGQHGARWFFTPSDHRGDGLPLLVFDLQQIYTLESAGINALLPARRAVLRSPFKEALVTKVYSYLTRVGSDDGYKNDLCLSILGEAGLKLPETPVTEGTSPVIAARDESEPNVAEESSGPVLNQRSNQ